MGSGSVAKLGWLAAHVTGTAPGGMYTFPSEHLRHVPDEAGHQGSSVVISGHQWSSVVISGHHGSSWDIRGHQGLSEVIRDHQGSSGVIRGHQGSSGVIMGLQGSSEVIRGAETRSREARDHQGSSGVIRDHQGSSEVPSEQLRHAREKLRRGGARSSPPSVTQSVLQHPVYARTLVPVAARFT